MSQEITEASPTCIEQFFKDRSPKQKKDKMKSFGEGKVYKIIDSGESIETGKWSLTRLVSEAYLIKRGLR